MSKQGNRKIKFAICVTDSEPDLELRKVYRVLPDASAVKDDYLRVMDESGEDYLYPASYFVLMELPQTAETALLSAF
jgi:hypothetical protein